MCVADIATSSHCLILACAYTANRNMKYAAHIMTMSQKTNSCNLQNNDSWCFPRVLQSEYITSLHVNPICPHLQIMAVDAHGALACVLGIAPHLDGSVLCRLVPVSAAIKR